MRIELQGVSNHILHGVDLCIEDGEFFALLGPSGAGKTTLLNVLAGLVPHRGRVLFNGRAVEGLPPQKRRVGYMFQDLLLFPHLSVTGNVMLAMRNQKLGRAEKKARGRRLLEMLQIAHLAGRKPENLSGGERQRAALARALASRPRILLLDEPFNNLDRQIAGRLRRELTTLTKELGLTTLLVTHNPGDARHMAGRSAFLRDGRIEKTGSTRQLLSLPGGLAAGREPRWGRAS